MERERHSKSFVEPGDEKKEDERRDKYTVLLEMRRWMWSWAGGQAQEGVNCVPWALAGPTHQLAQGEGGGQA